MKYTKRPLFWVVLISGLAIGLAIAMAGCSPSTGPREQVKSPKQIWIDAHPTHTGPNGDCFEADGELCDEDPFDLDDMTEWDKHNMSPSPKPKASVRPMQTGYQPKPSAAPVKPSARPTGTRR